MNFIKDQFMILKFSSYSKKILICLRSDYCESFEMLRDLPLENWFMEYRRLGLIENHESCVSLTFARVLFEFTRDGSVLPCNTLFKRTLHRYKGIYNL